MKLPKDKIAIVERHNKVVFDCGDSVIKVFNGNKPAADILNEALNLARADQAGIDVPELLEVGRTGANWAIATKKVEGKTLRQLINEDPDVERMADFVELELHIHAHKNALLNRQKDKYARMINSLGDDVINEAPDVERMADFVELELRIHAHKNALLNRQKDKYARMINSLGDDVINEATRYELLMRLDGMPNHNKVCHGDFVPSNIIVREDGSMCVCDWAHATQGNGGADCATTYLHLMLGGETEIAEKYLRVYCERQGCSMAYIQSWMSIVAAAELARGRVVEQDYLLSMIDVVDYY